MYVFGVSLWVYLGGQRSTLSFSIILSTLFSEKCFLLTGWLMNPWNVPDCILPMLGLQAHLAFYIRCCSQNSDPQASRISTLPTKHRSILSFVCVCKRTICRSWFSFIIWVLGLELRLGSYCHSYISSVLVGFIFFHYHTVPATRNQERWMLIPFTELPFLTPSRIPARSYATHSRQVFPSWL